MSSSVGWISHGSVTRAMRGPMARWYGGFPACDERRTIWRPVLACSALLGGALIGWLRRCGLWARPFVAGLGHYEHVCSGARGARG